MATSALPPTIAEASLAVAAGLLSCVDLTRACLRLTEAFDGSWGAFAIRFDESALLAAKEADSGPRDGLLPGIPVVVKDNIMTREGPTKAQSQVLDPGMTGQDAAVVERLRAVGAIVMGKAATMEFAVGPPQAIVGPHDEPCGATHNPWDPERWTGGSSSGTACAVAAGMALGGLGTDTGGSVRIPAALCGVTGFKPTYGLVPKSGCIPLAYSLDHIGPVARTAQDCALLLQATAGPHPEDPASVDRPVEAYTERLDGDLSGLRIGVDSLQRFVDPEIMDPAVPDVFATAVGQLAALGARIVPIELPYYEDVTEVYDITMSGEALAYHAADLAKRWYDYGVSTRTVIASGTFYTAADYVQAQRIRRLGQKALSRLFGDVDLVVTPTTSVAAPLFGELDRYYSRSGLWALHTQYWNAVGNPAISVPMGFNGNGLPLGLQIAGPAFADAEVLRAADAFQRVTSWHREVPPLVRDQLREGIS